MRLLKIYNIFLWYYENRYPIDSQYALINAVLLNENVLTSTALTGSFDNAINLSTLCVVVFRHLQLYLLKFHKTPHLSNYF